MKHSLAFSPAASLGPLAFAAALLLPGLALAGPVKVGEGPDSLETDEKGALTDAGKKSVVKQLDRIPGEDAWDFKMHAELERSAAEGPLYIEFYDKIMGNWQLVYRHEDANFDGNRKYVASFELQGNLGFNKDHTYRIKVVQVAANGKDIELASGEITLINTGREPEPDDESEDGEENEMSEQDALDSFVGGEDDDENADTAPEGGPPPVPPNKKGCAIQASAPADLAFNGLALLAVFGFAGISRRRVS